LEKIRERIKEAVKDYGRIDEDTIIDTKSLLFIDKNNKSLKLNKNGLVFKIKLNENGEIIYLVLLIDYEIKGIKEIEKEIENKGAPSDSSALMDEGKYILVARCSYFYPFIIVDLKGSHIKFNSEKEVPFMPIAYNFLSNIRDVLKNAIDSRFDEKYKIDKIYLANVLYEFFKKYNSRLNIENNKRVGNYMERIFYALVSTFKGRPERLGGKNEPDAKLEERERNVLYLFDTKNLHSSSIERNIKKRISENNNYEFTCVKYIHKLINENWSKIRFFYVLNKVEENKLEKIKELENEINDKLKEEFKNRDVVARIFSLEDFYEKIKESRTDTDILEELAKR
jgi:hypothetical protein